MSRKLLGYVDHEYFCQSQNPFNHKCKCKCKLYDLEEETDREIEYWQKYVCEHIDFIQLEDSVLCNTCRVWI